jgi:hypothetical protein
MAAKSYVTISVVPARTSFKNGKCKNDDTDVLTSQQQGWLTGQHLNYVRV